MIIITGASSGLGKSIKEHLMNQGNEIFTISRKKENDPNHFQCDVCDYENLKNIYKVIRNSGKNINAIINCAGIASMNLTLTTPKIVINNIINTNLIGTINVNQIFTPLLIKNKGGRIINFSTIAVSLGLAGEAVYVASKAGIEGFSRAFANEVAPLNITINCIAPGPIKTNLLKGISEKKIEEIVKRQIIKKIQTPLSVCEIVDLILDDKARNITGQVFHVGGF